MRILVLSQVFWPDSASTSQHLTDLAVAMAQKGHEIHVIASRKGYEEPSVSYPGIENYRGVLVERIRQTGFGKKSNIGRLIDSASFNLNLLVRLLPRRDRRYHVIIGMTSPPLVSFLGVHAARRNRSRFCYWVMDLQPELAIASGILRKGSIPARILTGLGDIVFRRADRIVALDRFMKEYIHGRGADPVKISVLPVWPVMNEVYAGPRSSNPFRVEYGFGDKLVVMYSGNHSVVHPLDTLLEAALRLRDDPRFLFVFIGGGVRKREVTAFRDRHGLENIRQLPYQPREKIHISLAAADFHVVVQGEGVVGFTHPNKIYGAMFIGRPIVSIGARPSHITDILDGCPGNIQVGHGEDGELARKLVESADRGPEFMEETGNRNREFASRCFDPLTLIGRMIDVIEGLR
jgi:glycosyltransferase involved in cell wall biosynthesis